MKKLLFLHPLIQIVGLIIAYVFVGTEIKELFHANLLYAIPIVILGVSWLGIWIWILIKSIPGVDDNSLPWKAWIVFGIFFIVLLAPSVQRHWDKEAHIEAPLNK
jgi:hypothetical protein